MNKDRLLNLAEFLDDLEEDRFDFHQWVSAYDEANECGTVCCAVGWMPNLDPEHWLWTEEGEGYWYPELRGSSQGNTIEDASTYFDIPQADAEWLFLPWSESFDEGKATPHWLIHHSYEDPELDYTEEVSEYENYDERMTPEMLADNIYAYVRS